MFNDNLLQLLAIYLDIFFISSYTTDMPNVFSFLNLQTPEIIIIFLIVLLLFGAKRLPSLARGIGKSLGEFKRAKDEFQHEMNESEQESYEQEKKATQTKKVAAESTETQENVQASEKES